MEAFQRENHMVGDSYAEEMEPALELCMKMQRSPGVKGRLREWPMFWLLIRVVPPKCMSYRSLMYWHRRIR